MGEEHQLSATEQDVLSHLLGEIERDLDRRRIDPAEDLWQEAAAVAGENHPEVLYARALIDWERSGPQAALPVLEKVVAADPKHADAHHALALAHEASDDFARMAEHFLAVRRLDEASDRRVGLGSKSDLDFIERVATQVLESVPEEFRERLRDIPIVLEPRPSEGIVAEGFDPRAFGLFEGLEDADQDRLAVAPTRIVLFCSNLLAAFPEDEQLAEQIEITILHEVGHFFGLDEDGVARLGLE